MTITMTMCQSGIKGPDNLYCHSDKLRNDSNPAGDLDLDPSIYVKTSKPFS